MKVLPVMDLRDGLVVRGVAGQRASYRPITSTICSEPTPRAVALSFARLGFQEVYIADLDAIAGAEPCWPAYGEVAASGLRLLLDAGVGSARRAENLLRSSPSSMLFAGVVVGLESLATSRELIDLAKLLGPRLGIFSLDLKAGTVLTSISQWRHSRPLDLVERAVAAGFRRVIVLDLAAVGVGEGPGVCGLCREIRRVFPELELISGGGVRHLADVRTFLDEGCDRVLVASALHAGTLAARDLAELQRSAPLG